MQSIMNLKIKYRESFRPFAPSIIIDKASESKESVNYNNLDKLKTIKLSIILVSDISVQN